ncbi:PP2C family protein-serine/threonine phosphatase [Miltoncostaea marina]|uniref:PP2C family protein-serine/threonine phosphatase n=1 Tax=Miltoncostaea marina TaxID=2843215 RepID=UPI001C3E6FDF|nr:SpoIIE family protein phosphatase [Miltoncostaea marina]
MEVSRATTPAVAAGGDDDRLLAQQTIDALASELAILDDAGRIIMVNRAWRRFGARNDAAGRDFLGQSYLSACAAADPASEGGVEARGFAVALREMLEGRRERYVIEYPCHSPDAERWFIARAARFTGAGGVRVVVTHEDITARHRSEERHRSIAQTLQASLMPAELPSIAGLELAARYRPEGEGVSVGGDFYDVFADGDDWVVVIGDVCGKGPAAAAVTAEARWTIRALAPRCEGPAALFEAVNEALVGRRRDARFITAALARVTPHGDGARVVCSRAGHPHPLVVRRAGAVEPVGASGGLLGVMHSPRFTDAHFDLEPGDALVLHTDGVSEARRRRAELGPEGVARALAEVAGAPADEIARRLEAAALRFSGGRLRDDVAVVVVRAADPAGAG